jgi:hypothetical protein
MALDLHVSRQSISRIVKNRLHLHPYKMQKYQLLTPKMCSTRLKKARALLARFAKNRHRQILFTDEKIFSVQQQINKQNNRILSPSLLAANQAGRRVARSSHPSYVMVWGGITYSGKTP